MVEKKDAGPKKRKRRKAKAKPRVGQVISQKVVVNVGKDVSKRKRRTGTQAKRSVQPQQVVYQNAPIPLQPNYSSQINDLRDEVRTHLSGVNLEDGRRRAIDLREQHDAQLVREELARRVAFQEGAQGTEVQAERQFEPAQRPETPAPLQATQAPVEAVALGTPVQGQRIAKTEPLGAGGGESPEPLGAGGGERTETPEPKTKRGRPKGSTKAKKQASRTKSMEPFLIRGQGAAAEEEEEKEDPSFV